MRKRLQDPAKREEKGPGPFFTVHSPSLYPRVMASQLRRGDHTLQISWQKVRECHRGDGPLWDLRNMAYCPKAVSAYSYIVQVQIPDMEVHPYLCRAASTSAVEGIFEPPFRRDTRLDEAFPPMHEAHLTGGHIGPPLHPRAGCPCYFVGSRIAVRPCSVPRAFFMSFVRRCTPPDKVTGYGYRVTGKRIRNSKRYRTRETQLFKTKKSRARSPAAISKRSRPSLYYQGKYSTCAGVCQVTNFAVPKNRMSLEQEAKSSWENCWSLSISAYGDRR